VEADVETERLILRQWRDADRGPFAALNADPEVMRYFPAPYTPDESNEAIDRQTKWIAERGWGLWAVEVRETGRFIGFVGLSVPRHELPFLPCVEIGWRLAKEAWGQGFASEAARASLAYGFDVLKLTEIVSFTALANGPSRRVMERIGMRDTGRDFGHPAVPEGHALRRHCLYAITADEPRRYCSQTTRKPTSL
jgi:RimJ/RimL family protein N-acetyltransferase